MFVNYYYSEYFIVAGFFLDHDARWLDGQDVSLFVCSGTHLLGCLITPYIWQLHILFILSGLSVTKNSMTY